MSEETTTETATETAYTPDEIGVNAPATAAGDTDNLPAVPGDSRGADVNLDLVLNVPVSVSLRVGATDIPIRDLVRLVEGSVISLDRDANQAMDVLVNGTLIAHGEIVVVDDKFGVRLTDVVSPADRIRTIN